MTFVRAVCGVLIGFAGTQHALNGEPWSLAVLIVACTLWLAVVVDA